MRAFIAIDFPMEIKIKIFEAIKFLNRDNLKVKWTKEENLHLTLKFLGEIKEEVVDKISFLVNESIKNVKSFAIKLKGIGAFPNEKAPRILWIGVSAGEENVISLSKNIKNMLEEKGICKKEEKDKNARHITIGRIKDFIKLLDFSTIFSDFKDYDFGEFKVSNIYLMGSTLKPEGPVYSILKSIPLA